MRIEFRDYSGKTYSALPFDKSKILTYGTAKMLLHKYGATLKHKAKTKLYVQIQHGIYIIFKLRRNRDWIILYDYFLSPSPEDAEPALDYEQFFWAI